jgi:ubiquinone/menaquinone biosynthesis C-methylase UbiE
VPAPQSYSRNGVPGRECYNTRYRQASSGTSGSRYIQMSQQTPKELWAEEADERIRYGKGFHWVESPIVSEYLNRNISGDPAVNWLVYSVSKYIHDRVSPRILSLACGGGALERDLLRLKPDAHIIAMDFSPGAIALAKRRSLEVGQEIDYQVADLNVANLEPNAFDFVVAGSALHHIVALEHILGQVRDCLKPGGLLIVNDYVGPNQLHWTPAQVQAINEILVLLPDHYRRRISNRQEYKREFLGPSPIADMNENDPTEAVRSSEIVALTRGMFDLLEFKPFGGTLLHMLLQDILGNFNPADETDCCVLRLICHLEWKLITTGALSSDFAYFVGQASR